ncbi:MAG: hypothetical protein M3Q36_01305 [bacterium]|nr:hypothetical protein [bacterium]
MINRFEQAPSDHVTERIIDITGLERFREDTFPYKNALISLEDYIGNVGNASPMARFSFEELAALPEDDPEFPNKIADIEGFVSSYMHLRKDENGEWVRDDRSSN